MKTVPSVGSPRKIKGLALPSPEARLTDTTIIQITIMEQLEAFWDPMLICYSLLRRAQ